MAKSIVSALLGKAISEGHIKSLDQPINTIPGEAFIYKSGATQLLGMAMENVLDQKLNRYLNKSFWQELGAEKEALWQVDRKKRGTEKFLCCFASNARDFARFGKLYKDHGRWNNSQLLDSTFIAKSLRPRFESSPQYGYGW